MGPYIQTKTTISSALLFHPFRTHLSEEIPPFFYLGKERNDSFLDDIPPAFS
jgi:hypothetical protein